MPKLSELIARGEQLVDTVRDFHRGANAVSDAARQQMAEGVQEMGRKNAELQRDVKELRARATEWNEAWGKLQIMESQATDRVRELEVQATRDRRETATLKDKLKASERQVQAHRETIRGYFGQLDAEAREGNPSNGKATSANTDGQ